MLGGHPCPHASSSARTRAEIRDNGSIPRQHYDILICQLLLYSVNPNEKLSASNGERNVIHGDDDNST